MALRSRHLLRASYTTTPPFSFTGNFLDTHHSAGASQRQVMSASQLRSAEKRAADGARAAHEYLLTKAAKKEAAEVLARSLEQKALLGTKNI